MKHALLFIATFFLVNIGSAQTPGCAGAMNLNINATFGPVASPMDTSIDYACINITPNRDVWYGYFTVCQSGTCSIQITNWSGDSLGMVVWGPHPSTANICQNLFTANAISCTPLQTGSISVSLGTVLTNQVYMIAVISDSAWMSFAYSTSGTAVVTGNCVPPPPVPGCAGAVDLNTSPFAGQSSPEDTAIDYGCVTLLNHIWYGYFTVCQGGTLNVSANTFNSAQDIDIVVWGPFSSTANLCTQLTTPNIAGCGATTGLDIVNLGSVSIGDVYMVAAVGDTNLSIPQFQHTGNAVITGNCVPPPPCYPVNGYEALCVVTVDSATQEYYMIWNEVSGNPVTHFGIMKADIFGNPQQIDTVQITSLSEYIDFSADPNVHTEQYSIVTYDTCGTYWSTGAYIQPVFCQSSLSTQNTVNVAWSSYYDGMGNGPVYYVIYRGATLANMVPLDTVATFVNNYTDINPLSGNSYYKIGVALYSPCVPMRVIDPFFAIQVASFSNSSPITVVGIEENSLGNVSIFPNPANDVMNINGVWEQSTMNIYDVAGRLVMTQTLQNAAAQQVELSSLEQGMYVMTIENEHGYLRKEIAVQR